MNHSYKRVAVFADLFDLLKTKFKPFRFPKIQFPVVLGIVRASRTAPTAGTAYNRISEFNAVVLEKIKSFVGSAFSELGYPVPPIIVVASDKNFFSFQSL